jgi:putative ABC transport system permease protein
MWPGEPYQLGKTLEMNDRRAVVVGVCKVSPPFITLPVIYTLYSRVTFFAPRERNLMTYVLAQPKDGVPAEEVCRRIVEQTGGPEKGLLALTRDQFFWKTIRYYLGSTGIPVNFGITIALGFIVGAAIAGQTFYLFTLENLKQFGALKAMGLANPRLIGMVFLQAAIVGLIGYCLGIGMTAAFFELTADLNPNLRGLHLWWQIAAGTAVTVVVIILIASVMSLRKVLVLEPAVVFRG